MVDKVKESSQAAQFWDQNLLSGMEHHKATKGDDFVQISLPALSAGTLQANKSSSSLS